MPKNIIKKLTFKADKESGIDACAFLGSIVLEAVIKSNIRHKFQFPFYGLKIDLKKRHGSEWILRDEYEKISQDIIKESMQDNAEYFVEIKNKSIKETEKFKKYTVETVKNIKYFSNKKLVDEFSQYVDQFSFYYGLGALSFMYESIISRWLTNSLLKKYKNASDIIQVLLKSNYKSFMVENEEALLKIKKIKSSQIKNQLIQKYIDNFFYIKTDYANSLVLNKKIILKESKNLKYAKQINQNSKSYHNINLNKKEKIILKILKETEIIRDKRKAIALVGLYGMYRFLEQGAKRSKIDLKIADKIFWFEFVDLIYNPKKIKKSLQNRKYVSIILDKNNIFYLDHNTIVGNKKNNKNIEEFQGTPASKGYVKGKINIILGIKDFKKFERDDILVTEMTRPEFMPIIKMSKAIITDEGSLTSHAAIIARELNKPCIVGAKIASKILKDGDLVEVDANKGIVKIIK